jgi:hypothetical protein
MSRRESATEFERHAIGIASDVLRELHDELRAAQLDARLGGISGHESSAGRNAEISIKLWRGTEFIDMIEDFIVWHGRPQCTTDQLRAWLKQSLLDLIDEAGREE